jgi:iduronate 2-sulfatase
MPLSWDVYFKANGDDGGCRANESIYNNVCPSTQPDSEFYDYMLANDTVGQLQIAKTLKSMDGSPTPFFIAAGLRRPHRVWHVPKRFYDLYSNDGAFPTHMPLALHKEAPVGMPSLAFIDNAWPSFHYGPGVGYVNDTIAALGRWGYYASVSFTDHNVGIILDSLDRLQLSSTTVVVFTGDQCVQTPPAPAISLTGRFGPVIFRARLILCQSFTATFPWC